jgi:hypothetical protein
MTEHPKKSQALVNWLKTQDLANTNPTEQNSDDSYKRLRPNIIECKIIDWLIQRGIRWWQIPKWCWLHNVYHSYYQETNSFLPLSFIEQIIEQADISCQLQYNNKLLLKRGIYWYDIPDSGEGSWLREIFQWDKPGSKKLEKELMFIVQGVLNKRALIATVKTSYEKISGNRATISSSRSEFDS